jgi:hypothetical protein
MAQAKPQAIIANHYDTLAGRRGTKEKAKELARLLSAERGEPVRSVDAVTLAINEEIKRRAGS